MADIMAGRLEYGCSNIGGVVEQIKAGNLKAVANLSKIRSDALPDLKTADEQGFKDFDAVSWGGLMAPPGTPKDVVDRISTEVKAILADKEVQDKLLNAGAIANYQGPDQMAKRVRGDYAKWGQVIRDKGIVFE